MNIYYISESNNFYNWMQIIIPTVLTILGWITIYYLNKKLNDKTIKEEKKLAIKIEAYNYIKAKLDNLFVSIDNLINRLNHLYQHINYLYQTDEEKVKEALTLDVEKDFDYFMLINKLKRDLKEKNELFHKSCDQYKLILNKFSSDIIILEEKSENLHKALNEKVSVIDQTLNLTDLRYTEKLMNNIIELLDILNEYDNQLYLFLDKIQRNAYEDLF